MTDKLKQIVIEELAKVSPEQQGAINSLPWADISEEISKKYSLDESTLNDLQTETFLVLIGLEEPFDFSLNLGNNAGLESGTCEKIGQEIEERIFIPINDALIEKIKESDRAKASAWHQNVNFILSGGNYGAFMSDPDQPAPGDGNNKV
jgi:hypothetical protein